MCVNYKPPRPSEIAMEYAATLPPDPIWPDEIWQDYAAPIIVRDDERRVLVGSYGMVPKRHIPAGVKKFTTMNARSETIGKLRSYSRPWRDGQLCLVPCHAFYEPNWETGKHVRWRIGMADGSPFAVAGLWRTWTEIDGRTTHSFTQLTINADDHPLMKRFHKPGDEKRSLVILPKDEWDDWMACRDPEVARSFLRPCPAELMSAEPAPRTLPAQMTLV